MELFGLALFVGRGSGLFLSPRDLTPLNHFVIDRRRRQPKPATFTIFI